MSPFSARIVPALAAVFVVAFAGCSTKQPGAQTSSVASSASAPRVAPKVITQEDAVNKKSLRLKLGAPATYQRDGVSITVAPQRVEKVEGTPQPLEGQIINCGSWWRVTQTWTIDIKPDAAWHGWRRDFQGLFGLFSEAKNEKFGFYSDVATAVISDMPDDLDRALSAATRAWTHKEPFHFDQTGPQYLAGCKINDGADASKVGEQFVPETRPITELEWNLPSADGQNPRTWPTLAIWTV